MCFALLIYKKQFVFSQPEFEYLRAEVSWFAPYLYEEREEEKKSDRDVVGILTYSGNSFDVTDTACLAQGGSTHSRVFFF